MQALSQPAIGCFIAIPTLAVVSGAKKIERDVARTREVVRRVAVANPAHLVADGKAA
jgi:hypothetical protein